jgi:hypothetical protein
MRSVSSSWSGRWGPGGQRAASCPLRSTALSASGTSRLTVLPLTLISISLAFYPSLSLYLSVSLLRPTPSIVARPFCARLKPSVQLHTLHPKPYILHPTLCTLHPIPSTLLRTPYTLQYHPRPSRGQREGNLHLM